MSAGATPLTRPPVPAASRPPTLATHIALQVAWSSIRIRLTRNLVTVSSVVLAVAFLLTVIGEAISTHAVYRRFHDDSRISEQTQQIREALSHPRATLALLHLLVERSQEVCAWSKRLGHEIPAVDPHHCLLCERLGRWVAALRPAQTYVLTHNHDIDDWLLHLDHAGAIDQLIAESARFTGSRLPLSHAELEQLVAGMPATRGALEALRQAESARLLQVDDSGGPSAVIDRVIDQGDLESAGLPLTQVLGELDPAAHAAVVHQLILDRLRTRVALTLSQDNRRDPALLQAADIRDWAALSQAMITQLTEEGDSPARRLAAASDDRARFAVKVLEQAPSDPQVQASVLAAINAALASSQVFDEVAWEHFPFGADARDLLKLDRAHLNERQVTRLNRLLIESAYGTAIIHRPVDGPYDLQLVADRRLFEAPANARIHDVLVNEVGGAPLAELGQELRMRASLAERSQAFVDMGYDAQAGNARLLCLIALSLLVCVVGIVNSMMMAVSERFREIATMKCLGATDAFIRKTFMIESSATGLVGATLGVLLGMAIVLGQASSRFGAAFWDVLPASSLVAAGLGALGCGVVLAILGALLPAHRAAAMHPVEAMRAEG